MWILIGRNEEIIYRITWKRGHLRFEPPSIRQEYLNTIRRGVIAPDPVTDPIPVTDPVPYDQALSWVAFRVARQTLWDLGARRMRVEGDGWQWPTRSRSRDLLS